VGIKLDFFVGWKEFLFEQRIMMAENNNKEWKNWVEIE